MTTGPKCIHLNISTYEWHYSYWQCSKYKSPSRESKPRVTSIAMNNYRTMRDDTKHFRVNISTHSSCLTYTNIDLKLQNKLHGSMHYKIGVTQDIYSVVITLQSNPPISKFSSRVMNSEVSGQCFHAISRCIYRLCSGPWKGSHLLIETQFVSLSLTIISLIIYPQSTN